MVALGGLDLKNIIFNLLFSHVVGKFIDYSLFTSLIRTHDKLTCQMEIQLLLDEKVLWTQTVGEMETNMALNYTVLLRSPSPDATVQV